MIAIGWLWLMVTAGQALTCFVFYRLGAWAQRRKIEAACRRSAEAIVKDLVLQAKRMKRAHERAESWRNN